MPNSFNAVNRNLEALENKENRGNRMQRKEYNPFADPNFDPDKLEVNEIKLGQGAVAKIPVMPDRVFIRESEDGTLPKVMFIADRYKDEKTGEMVDEVVPIGTDFSSRLPKMMMISEHYHEYFDLEGRIIHDPMERRFEQEMKEKLERLHKEKEEQEQKEKETAEKTTVKETAEKPARTKAEERTVEDIRASLLEKEKLLEQKIQEAEAEKQKFRKFRQEGEQLVKQLEKQKEELEDIKEERLFSIEDRVRQHVELMHEILIKFVYTVDELAKRKPYSLMSLRQIKTINEILKELKYYFSTSNAADYLHLAEEPREDDLEHYPGTTYGEMALLLDAYLCTHTAFKSDKLYERNAANRYDDVNDNTSGESELDEETNEKDE